MNNVLCFKCENKPKMLIYCETLYFLMRCEKMNGEDNDIDCLRLILRCLRCVHGISLDLGFGSSYLDGMVVSWPIIAKMGDLLPENRVQKLSEITFEFQAAVRRKWQVFFLRTTDIGTDYMIGKGRAKLQIQLRSSGIRGDKRYNFYLTSFEEDPTAFFVYLLIHHYLKTELELDSLELDSIQYEFYIIPTTEMKRIKRFREAFETKTWKTKGKYNCPLTLDQARQKLEEYKDEKGWKKLERHI